MKPTARLAAALRRAADRIDPPAKEKKPRINLAPVNINFLDWVEPPGPVIPLPDVAWNKTGWGSFV